MSEKSPEVCSRCGGVACVLTCCAIRGVFVARFRCPFSLPGLCGLPTQSEFRGTLLQGLRRYIRAIPQSRRAVLRLRGCAQSSLVSAATPDAAIYRRPKIILEMLHESDRDRN